MKVELTDDQLCELLTVSVEDYAKEVQNWVIQNKWQSLYGKKVSTLDMAFGLSMRTLDYAKDYSYWFSKEVGLQQRGNWEMKKDYVTIECGKQDYLIPAGREINKVMYLTKNSTQAALYAGMGGFGGMSGAFGNGFGSAQVGGGFGGMGYGMGGMMFGAAYDTMLLASDLNVKNRLFGGDLAYKVTAGPDGTKILHLLSTPKINFGFSGFSNGILGIQDCEVWYTYYDVDSSNIDQCRKDNPDLLITPDQVPLTRMNYEFFNEPTKVTIRQLLVAQAKQTLGLIRGKFSGQLKIANAESQMDYQMLLTQGKDEKTDTVTELKERLKLMNPLEMMKIQNAIGKELQELLGQTPLGLYIK
jgi:hypothetical protein